MLNGLVNSMLKNTLLPSRCFRKLLADTVKKSKPLSNKHSQPSNKFRTCLLIVLQAISPLSHLRITKFLTKVSKLGACLHQSTGTIKGAQIKVSFAFPHINISPKAPEVFQPKPYI